MVSRRRKARSEIFTTPELVTAARSILGLPLPGPSLRKYFHFPHPNGHPYCKVHMGQFLQDGENEQSLAFF